MDRLEAEALAAFLHHRGDALALARRASRAAPGRAAPRLLEASLLLCSRYVADFWTAKAILREDFPRMEPRERGHHAALSAAAEGDYARATRVYDAIIDEDPCDLLALAVAQVFDYFLGNAQSLRARSAKAVRAMPRHHAVLSMHAFALEECGDYEQAEAVARHALELEPFDLRAHHAVAHVMEMQGRFEEGVRWMGTRSRWWTGAGAASTHLWWHLALYHLELGRHEQALAIYDRRMRGRGLSELIDRSALLWRLQLAGVEVGGRFEPLAAAWAPHAADAYCAFNDVHAMMAFAGAGRWDCAARLIAAQETRVAGAWSTNHDMTRLVGLPACRALAAFGRGDYAAAERLLRALPPVAHRIGGSHAQRDVLHLTRYAAALRKARIRGQSRNYSFREFARAA